MACVEGVIDGVIGGRSGLWVDGVIDEMIGASGWTV